MTYRVEYAQAAARQIESLDLAVKERVRLAIERLRVHPELGKRLAGLLADRWSYRAGDWRILYQIRKNELLILVLHVGHRSRVYRR